MAEGCRFENENCLLSFKFPGNVDLKNSLSIVLTATDQKQQKS